MGTRLHVSRRRFVAGLAGGSVLGLFAIGRGAPAALADAGIAGVTASSTLRAINSNGVRVRSGAGTGFSIVLVVNTGEIVELLSVAGSANGYEWGRVRVQRTGQTGYVATQFLSPVPGGDYPIGSTFHVDTANGGGAYLRSAASSSASVVRVVANGTNGTIQGGPTQASGYTWYRVTIAGSTGWMATVVMAPGSGGGSRPQIRVADGPLRVRQAPGLAGAVILTVSTGATGEVTTQMPVTKDGYVWVNVRFFNQANTTGIWVAQTFLTYL
jgi:uncharacterized protein YgiM (DUF1202 family)